MSTPPYQPEPEPSGQPGSPSQPEPQGEPESPSQPEPEPSAKSEPSGQPETLSQPEPPSQPEPSAQPEPPPAPQPGPELSAQPGLPPAPQQPDRSQNPWDPAGPGPGAWAPSSPSGVPYGGYAVPPPGPGQAGPPGHDPLISPDYSGWFSRATAIVKAGWRPLAVLQVIGGVTALIVQLPFILWALTASTELTESIENDPEATPELGLFFGVFGLTLVGVFVAILVAALVSLASMRIGVAVATGVEPNIGAALRGAVNRMFPLLGWQILAGFIMVAGVCACVLPVVYLYAVFVTLPAVVAFERTNVIGRCFKLFHADLGAAVARVATIAGFTIAAGVLASIIDAVMSAITGASTGQFSTDVPDDITTGALLGSALLTTVISVIIGGAVAVFTSQLTLTAYADLRARVEPLSTGMLANEIGLQPQAPTGPAAAW